MVRCRCCGLRVKCSSRVVRSEVPGAVPISDIFTFGRIQRCVVDCVRIVSTETIE
jgi:hypothetical protein